jgi:hypothetical protein
MAGEGCFTGPASLQDSAGSGADRKFFAIYIFTDRMRHQGGVLSLNRGFVLQPDKTL